MNSNNCKCNMINDEITYDKYYFLKERNIKLMNNSLRISVLLKDFINNNRNNNVFLLFIYNLIIIRKIINIQ